MKYLISIKFFVSLKALLLEKFIIFIYFSERASSPKRTAKGQNPDKNFPMAHANLATKELDNKTQLSRSIRNHSDRIEQHSDFYYNTSR